MATSSGKVSTTDLLVQTHTQAATAMYREDQDNHNLRVQPREEVIKDTEVSTQGIHRQTTFVVLCLHSHSHNMQGKIGREVVAACSYSLHRLVNKTIHMVAKAGGDLRQMEWEGRSATMAVVNKNSKVEARPVGYGVGVSQTGDSSLETEGPSCTMVRVFTLRPFFD
jgi:hypothetical protein